MHASRENAYVRCLIVPIQGSRFRSECGFRVVRACPVRYSSRLWRNRALSTNANEDDVQSAEQLIMQVRLPPDLLNRRERSSCEATSSGTIRTCPRYTVLTPNRGLWQCTARPSRICPSLSSIWLPRETWSLPV